MCGIVGFNFENRALLKKCMQSIEHRGPDGSGKFEDGKVSLGHARLRILDLSDNAKQPMFNKKQTIGIVFNGEIYNFLELKQKLSEFEFRSTSDTEVILYLYEKFGENFVEMLNGIFAIAIYDIPNKKLLLYRDPIGVKPLYYYFQRGKFIFASEIKAILECEGVSRKLDQNAFKAFLQLRFIPWPMTIFEEISKLPPSHMLKFSNGKTELRQFHYNFAETFRASDNVVEKVRTGMEKAVKDQMVSDVEVGAFLSGGVDSSIVTALMSRHSKSAVKTFSVRFPESEFDESEFADSVSKEFGTEHHAVDFSESAAKYLKEVVYALDEPLADPAALPTFLLSKEAKKKVSVVLTGEGADELFGGYEQVNIIQKTRPLFVLPAFLRKQAGTVLKWIPKPIVHQQFPYLELLGEEAFPRIEQFLESEDDISKYLSMVEIASENEYREMVPKLEEFSLPDFVQSHSQGNGIDQILSFEFQNTLPENLLMKVDKTSMNFGLEARVPFLDLNFSSYVRSIPSHFLLSRGKEKAVLRKSFQGVLPTKILERKKQRFFVPIHEWLEKDSLFDKEKVLDELAREKWISAAYAEKVHKGFSNSRLFYSRQLWSLLCFSLWKEQFLD